MAARNHIVPMQCLPRALALRRMLTEWGIAADLRLGVRREGDALVAHAWVEHQGEPVGIGAADAKRFSQMAKGGGT